MIRSVLLSSFVLVTPAFAWQDTQTEDPLEKLRAEVARLRGDDDGSYREFTSPEDRLAWYARHVEMKEASPYKDLEWKFVGPRNVSGRVTDVAVGEPRGKTYVIFVATASGGVWKSVNEGTSWEPVFDQAASTSIGDVTISPSNPEIVWIGTGEANIFRSSMAGCGVFKSTDGGETWESKGLEGTHTIPRILVHPTNPEIVYVAASGHEWTWNEDRGVFKTTDGGETWEKVLYVNDTSGAIDLVMHPTKPDTLYAATWQRIRRRWHDPRNELDYAGSGIWKTTDGGETWNPIDEGLPAPEHRGRIGIDIARSNPDVLYAFIDNYRSDDEGPAGETDSYGRQRARKGAILGATVFRSDDGGSSWRQTSEADRKMRRLSGTYGWVFGQIRVDPTDENKIYVMGLGLNVSEDAGKSFKSLRGMHGDHHALWIDPANPNYLVNGNDGGVAISYDGGEKWRTSSDSLPAVQFFNLASDMDEPFHVYGSVQDHGSYRGEIDISRGLDRLRPVDFDRAPGGEGSSHAIDPTNPDIVYSAGFYGRISRSHRDSGERKNLLPDAPEGGEPWRGQWVAPFILSPHNPRILYHGMNVLMRSLDRGESMVPISADLTGHDPREVGDIAYHTLFAISESPLRFGLVYTGSDDGRVHITRDGGQSWKEITDGLARERWISRIEASRHADGRVWLSQNGKRHDDFRPLLWKSEDHGETWEDLSVGIPSGPINVVREDPKNEDILYVGTDIGVYISKDRGQSFDTLGDLPSTFVHDLLIHPRDDVVVIGTHGRGVWALDAKAWREEEAEAETEATEEALTETDDD